MEAIEPFDAAPYIDTPEAEAHLLSDAFESGDAAYIAHALGIVTRARGIALVAKEAGLSRPAIYAAISGESDPKLSTLLSLFTALGVKIVVEPQEAA
ncbi:putative addiction module antidote protein [Amaricoccus sp. HAR-UPW-R2A-40]|nr:putative addiction module antidote protein [Amaricoccus sp. HAR-UPW-R2A-40]